MTKSSSLLGRLFKRVLQLSLLMGAAGLAFVWYIGAWNLLFPSSGHDAVAPVLPEELTAPTVMVFSKTNSFRHKEGIEGGNLALADIAEASGWGIWFTENGAVFNSQDLSRFDVVVFQNATGDMLSATQQQAFQAWLENGGGWLGIHSAGDGSHQDWPWYMENLIGADFTAHIMGPQFQRATVYLENNEHPALVRIPDIWDHDEEWYSWSSSPREKGFKILATIDEDSYTPMQKIFGKEVDLSMGDHPVVWSNCVGSGRSLYAAMGHSKEAFSSSEFRQLLQSSLQWLIKGQGEGC